MKGICSPICGTAYEKHLVKKDMTGIAMHYVFVVYWEWKRIAAERSAVKRIAAMQGRWERHDRNSGKIGPEQKEQVTTRL